MAILTILIELAGATMLLLYAVRMVRTGIERAFGASFKRVVTRVTHPLSAALTGTALAIILQSSAAVALLVTGFAEMGAIGFSSGLAVVLGADLGSALLIQILSFKLEWLLPVLLTLGGAFFTKSDHRKLKQAGRIILGIAFILISLRFLREAMEPVRDSSFLPAISEFLVRDYLTAFLVGAGLAFVMHSSVAVILMCVTLVAIGALPVEAGVSLVLGANLGSALIPLWLSRGMSPNARQVSMANLFLRGTGAISALIVVNQFSLLGLMTGLGPEQTLVSVHILFNLLLLLALPFCSRMEGWFVKLMPEKFVDDEVIPLEHRSVLDTNVIKVPHLALAGLRRETLRMLQVVESMTAPVMEVYGSGNRPRIKAIRAKDDVLDKALDDIRHYAASMPANEMTKEENVAAQELTEYAIAIEIAGDVITKRLMPLATVKASKDLHFSKAGLAELATMHELLISNISLASNVLISEDLESARLLLEEKTEMRRLEQDSRKKHLRRLSEGETMSFDSSDIHLETLRAFRDANSEIAAVAYPILYRNGQLLETRLITQLDEVQAKDLS
jgi:phosphate:Na+ symporter